jgi:hypothetical protein
MKSSILFVLAIFLVAIPLTAADTVSGKWKIHQSVAGNDSDTACTFTQTGEDLTGTCDGQGGAVKITGKVSEKKITWTVQAEYQGSPLTLKYTGTLASPEKMTGTLTVEPFGVEGEFTAVPDK